MAAVQVQPTIPAAFLQRVPVQRPHEKARIIQPIDRVVILQKALKTRNIKIVLQLLRLQPVRHRAEGLIRRLLSKKVQQEHTISGADHHLRHRRMAISDQLPAELPHMPDLLLQPGQQVPGLPPHIHRSPGHLVLTVLQVHRQADRITVAAVIRIHGVHQVAVPVPPGQVAPDPLPLLHGVQAALPDLHPVHADRRYI